MIEASGAPPIERSSLPTLYGTLLLVVLAIVVVVSLVATFAQRHESGLVHSFTTQDGQTIEWIGDTCQVVPDAHGVNVLVCTERG